MVKRYNQLILTLLKASDIAVAVAAWALAYGARYLGGETGITEYPLPAFKEFLPPMVFSLVLVPLIFSRLDLYISKRTKSLALELAEMLRGVVMVWMLTYVFANLTRNVMISRLMMVSLLAAWVPLALISRLMAKVALHSSRRRGWNQRYAAIIGTGRLGQKLCHVIHHNL